MHATMLAASIYMCISSFVVGPLQFQIAVHIGSCFFDIFVQTSFGPELPNFYYQLTFLKARMSILGTNIQ